MEINLPQPKTVRMLAIRQTPVFHAVTWLVLATQFWFPIMATAQSAPPINYPEQPIPTAPDFLRRDPLNITNYPARPTPTLTPNYGTGVPGSTNTTPGAATPTAQVVPTANDAQSLIQNTLVPSQNPPTVLHPLVLPGLPNTPAPSAYYGSDSSGFGPNGGGQINIREMFPGSTGDTILYDNLNVDPTAIRSTAAQVKANISQIGCRTTRFALMTDPGGGFSPSIVMTVKTLRITLIPIAGTNPIEYTKQRDFEQENYNGIVNIAVPVLGYASTKEQVVREATPNRPGLSLYYQLYPFNAPNDGTYFPFFHNIGGALAGGFDSVGGLGDHFTPKGIVTMNGTLGYMTAYLFAVNRTFGGTVPTAPCPPDPPGCVLDNVNTCLPMATGVAALFSVTKSSTQKAMDTLNTSVFVPHPLTNDPDLQVVVGANKTMQNDSNPVYNELFGGCTYSSENPGSTTTTYHKPDIYHCQNLRKQQFVPNGCDGTRNFTFALLQSQHVVVQVDVYQRTPWPRPPPTCNTPTDVLTGDYATTWVCTPVTGAPYAPTLAPFIYTDVPSTYTGPINHTIALVNGGGTVREGPLSDGKLFNYTIFPLAGVPADQIFPWNIQLVSTPTAAGTVSGAPLTAGLATDNWTMHVTGTATAASSWQIQTDIEQVLFNQIVGCDNYMAMLADRFCSGKMDCSEDRALPGPQMDVGQGFLVNADGTGVYGGVAKLLVPWGPPDSAVNNTTTGAGPIVPVPNSCWKAHGQPMTCSFGTGPIPCYIDAQGNEVCGNTQTCVTDPITNIQTCDPGLVSHFGDPDFIDNCGIRTGPPSVPGPLFGNPACNSINGAEQVCAPGASGIFSRVCYVYDVTYDCGTDQTLSIPVGSTTPVIQQCGSPIRCLGTECHNPKPEDNPDFAKVAVTTAVVDGLQHDLGCGDNTPATVDALGNLPPGCQLMIFPGKWMWCKVPIGTSIGLTPDCCAQSDEAAQGVDILSYIKLAMAMSKLANLPAVQMALANIPGYKGLIDSFQNMSSELSGAADATLKFMQDAYSNIASELGVFTETAPGESAAGLLSGTGTGLGGLVNYFQQLIFSALHDLMVEVFGPEITSMFIAGGSSATMSVVGEGTTGETYVATTEVADYSAGVILEALNVVMLVYAVLQIIGHIVFKCEAQELQLGIQRKIGNCHSVGGYCKSKFLGVTCAEWRNSYCCYKTPLARIINEQVKRQLYGIQLNAGYGEASNPSCGGLTINELTAADWSRIDLTEWLQIMQDAGLMAKNAPDAAIKYDTNANENETLLGLKINPPVTPPVTLPLTGARASRTVQKDAVTTPPFQLLPSLTDKIMLDFGDKTLLIGNRRQALATQPVCYRDPEKLPWYAGDVPAPGAVIEQIGGTGQMTSCGDGCIEITLGKPERRSSCGSGSVIDQNYAINVLLPAYIRSASVTEATWDDHLQINIAGNEVYTSPSFYTGGELGTIWCLTQATQFPGTAEPGETCTYPSNVPAGGLPPPGIDVTALFQSGGVIQTDTIVKVWGCGHGYAKLQVHYGAPPPTDPVAGDCIAPPTGVNMGAGGMVCNASASATLIAAGQQVRLIDDCTPIPTSHVWTASAGCVAPIGGATATVTSNTAGTCTYTDSASDGARSTTASVTVTYSMGCSITADNARPFTGERIRLTDTCLPVAMSYAWGSSPGCSIPLGSRVATVTELVAETCTYTVTATEGTNTATTSITISFDELPSAVPVCTLGDTFTGVGQGVLTANCSGNPTSYAWTNCSSVTAACSVFTPPAGGTVTYTVVATNIQGNSVPVSLTINWAAPAGVPVCIIAFGDALPTGGFQLVAICTNIPTSYTWTNCSSVARICDFIPPPLGGQVVVTVVANSDYGPSTPVSVTLNYPTNVPVCSSISVTTLALNSYELQAVCSNSPTSYTWTNCTSSTSLCTPVRPTTGSTVTYTMTATNASGTSSPPLSVNITYPPPSAAPQCSVAASGTSATGYTLVANCTNSPTSYTWVSCTSTTNTCAPSIPTVAVSVTYAVFATNAGGTGSASITLVYTGAPAVPVCTLAAIFVAFRQVSLVATCSGSPTSYGWANCTSASSACTPVSPPVEGPVTYTVIATNANGTSTPVSTTVTYTAPAGTPVCTIAMIIVGFRQITLNATCSGSPTSFNWSNATYVGLNCVSTGPTCSPPAPPFATTIRYTLSGVNASGTGALAYLDVTWIAP